MLRLIKKFLRKSVWFLPDKVVGDIYFELFSFFGSVKSRQLALYPEGNNFINLGSGCNVVPGCINIDFYTTKGIDYGADLRRPLKIASDVVDGIFCEHTVEHLTYAEAGRLLNECHRVMKKGGVIRVVVPDISLFIENYHNRNSSWFQKWERLMFIDSTDQDRARRRLDTPLQAISFVTQEYGHVSCWDFETLSHYLGQSGFREIRKREFRDGICPELLLDLDSEDRKYVSIYMEAIK